MAGAKEVIFVVMGGGIVFAAYRRPDLAHRHARCLTGVTVEPLDTSKISPELRAAIEILDALPPEIAADIATDWEHDDDVTPVGDGVASAPRTKTKESPPLVVSVDEIEDALPSAKKPPKP